MRRAAPAPVALVVPSLVNRAYMLDLMPRQVVDALSWPAPGCRPLLLDWGEPGPLEAPLHA